MSEHAGLPTNLMPGDVRLPDGRIDCRARIEGTYKGQPFVFEDPPGETSQFISPSGDPATWWWTEGNMGCDCNRLRFLGATPETYPELFDAETGEEQCGETIMLHRITPLDPRLPILDLDLDRALRSQQP